MIAQVDHELGPYGGLGTITREDQVSNRFISDEIAQNRVTATYVPAIFFCVAMFLLQNVLSRLIDMQRTQIGLMKAFGYGNVTVGLHYLQFACLMAAAGAAVGIAGGLELGSYLTGLYAKYYRLARLEFRIDIPIIAWAVFLMIKLMNRLKREEPAAPAAPAEPSEEVKLLREIRDSLAKR